MGRPRGARYGEGREDDSARAAGASPFRPRAIVGSYNVTDPSSYDPRITPRPRINGPVFAFCLVGVVALVVWALIARDQAAGVLQAVTGWITQNLGWFYILTATVAVVFVVVVAFARTGTVRMGPDHSRPEFGLFSWSAMLFAAGIGVDLMFFAVAEPVSQYFAPPQGGGETREAAEDAVVYALFHYGITGWALYALLGMAFGYFAYRLNMPLAIRSALYPLIGRRIHGGVGNAVDIAATLGTIFGIAASLGIGVVQLNYGLRIVFGIEEGLAAQTALVVIGVFIAIASSVSGVDKGIRRLSELNVLLAIVLMVVVVCAGKTAFLFDALMMNIGDYVSNFLDWTLDTYAFTETPEATRAWLETWTLFFWAWWVAWAPFVGLFLARISRGRTLRQFVIGTMTVPFIFVLLWMSFFGNSALDRVLSGDREFGLAAMAEPQRGFYELLADYPAGTVLTVLATFIGLLLYVTSADSGALVMSNFTSRIKDSRQDGPPWARVVWSLVIGVLTLVMLRIDGVATVQAATIVMGLPFTIVVYLIMVSLWKSLRLEAYREDSGRAAFYSAMSGRSDPAGDWRGRLRRAATWPDGRRTGRYVKEVAAPVLERVAMALQAEGFDATLLTAEVPQCPVPQLDLGVAFGEDKDFRYQLYPVVEELPGFAPTGDDTADTYYRLEVHGTNGSLGYDVFGYSEEQLVDNVIDLFERHLEFLHLGAREFSGGSDISDGAEPTRTWTE